MKKIAAAIVLCLGIMMLAACGAGEGAVQRSVAPEASKNPGNVYRVIVKDEAGKPVQGVAVQFCSDKMCQMGETDADGIAVYKNFEEAVHTIHVYSVPEGYAEDDTEYTSPETYGDIEITLKAAQ